MHHVAVKSSATAGNTLILAVWFDWLLMSVCWPPNTGPLLVSTAGFATEVDADIITKNKTKEKAKTFRMLLPSQG